VKPAKASSASSAHMDSKEEEDAFAAYRAEHTSHTSAAHAASAPDSAEEKPQLLMTQTSSAVTSRTRTKPSLADVAPVMVNLDRARASRAASQRQAAEAALAPAPVSVAEPLVSEPPSTEPSTTAPPPAVQEDRIPALSERSLERSLSFGPPQDPTDPSSSARQITVVNVVVEVLREQGGGLTTIELQQRVVDRMIEPLDKLAFMKAVKQVCIMDPKRQIHLKRRATAESL